MLCRVFSLCLNTALAILFIAPNTFADASSREAYLLLVDRYEARSKTDYQEPPDVWAIADIATRVKQDLTDLQAIDPRSFEEESLRIEYEVLEAVLHADLHYWDAGGVYIRIGPFWSPHRNVQDMHMRGPVKSLADLEAYAASVAEQIRRIDKTIELLRKGIALGITPPRSTIEHVPAEIQSLLDENLEHLEAPFSWTWERVPAGPRDELWARFKLQTIPAMTRSLTQLQAYLSDEYLPKCREEISIESLPNGAELYRSLLRQQAETDLSPTEIHAWGLEEVARLRKEMADVIREMNIALLDEALEDDALVDAFYAYARNAPEFCYETEEEVLQAYRNTAKLVDHWLPTMFRKLPRLTFGVMPMRSGRQN
jgi:uncharacterized protein (DUF885 family)